MPYYWFSNYERADWSPERGYNDLFARQVRDLREWFSLKKDGPGREKSTGKWREYQLQKKKVFITVESMRWDEYRRRVEAKDITPIFRLHLKIARLSGVFKNSRTVFFKEDVLVEFPRRYPAGPPRFRIDKDRYTGLGASHDHHMYSGGWLCILASSSDWRKESDTIISALGAALDWIVWHHEKFGW